MKKKYFREWIFYRNINIFYHLKPSKSFDAFGVIWSIRSHLKHCKSFEAFQLKWMENRNTHNKCRKSFKSDLPDCDLGFSETTTPDNHWLRLRFRIYIIVGEVGPICRRSRPRPLKIRQRLPTKQRTVCLMLGRRHRSCTNIKPALGTQQILTICQLPWLLFGPGLSLCINPWTLYLRAWREMSSKLDIKAFVTTRPPLTWSPTVHLKVEYCYKLNLRFWWHFAKNKFLLILSTVLKIVKKYFISSTLKHLTCNKMLNKM